MKAILIRFLGATLAAMSASLAFASTEPARAETVARYGPTGVHYDAAVVCDTQSHTIVVTASAGAASGYSEQWIGAYHYVQNIYTGKVYGPYGPFWIHHYPMLQTSGTLYPITEYSETGFVQRRLSIPQRGYYRVFTLYQWWNAAGTAVTAEAMTLTRNYTTVYAGDGFSQCLVGTDL